jgi:hypothetical protein
MKDDVTVSAVSGLFSLTLGVVTFLSYDHFFFGRDDDDDDDDYHLIKLYGASCYIQLCYV